MKIFQWTVALILAMGLFAGFMTALTNPWPGWPILGAILVGGIILVRAGGKTQRLLAVKRRTAVLEAGAGVPLILSEQTCASCGKPLLFGAKFCSYCHRRTEANPACVCVSCGTRNASDALFCGVCGEELKKTEEAKTQTRRTSVAH